MSVNPVHGNTPISSQGSSVNQQPANSVKNNSTVPQDTVTLSAAAKAKQTASSGDVDHDGDSK